MADEEELQRKIRELEEQVAKLKAQASSSESTLTGSGAIAQGETPKAVGAGGVLVGGDVHGDVHIQNVVAPTGPTPLPLDEARSRSLTDCPRPAACFNTAYPLTVCQRMS